MSEEYDASVDCYFCGNETPESCRCEDCWALVCETCRSRTPDNPHADPWEHVDIEEGFTQDPIEDFEPERFLEEPEVVEPDDLPYWEDES